ncbi:UNKNOWN [Stylonychia lemnae]|uniref:Uncharacterized protein n=1 Tax=Stylonychia lemnae TaxID=5949 RepID=A0A078AGZ6_STYLE|nr:UNKNOWN [Stylonychia lemnae]|eukprot:CDW80792.1 UNKNOWN [Stylonychia lemnae]
MSMIQEISKKTFEQRRSLLSGCNNDIDQLLNNHINQSVVMGRQSTVNQSIMEEPKRKSSFTQLSAKEKTNFFNNLVYSEIAANKSTNKNEEQKMFGYQRRFDNDPYLNKSQSSRNNKSPNLNNGFESQSRSRSRSFKKEESKEQRMSLFGNFRPGPQDYSPKFHLQSQNKK